MHHAEGQRLTRRAAHAARHLGYGIDRVLADRRHGRSSSIAPRRTDGTRPVVFSFNSNGGGH